MVLRKHARRPSERWRANSGSFMGLGASFFRAAAARIGMTVTDLQVMDLLESAGPMTAGQLADLTGLTTGAITGMLNRLEESGLRAPGTRPRRRAPGHRPACLRRGRQVREIDSVFDIHWEGVGGAGSRTTTMSRLALMLDFLQAQQRAVQGRNWSGCEQLQRMRRASTPLLWENLRAPGWSSLPGSTD